MKTIQSYVKNLTFIILINFIINLFQTQSLRIVLSLKNCLDKIPYIQEHLNLLNITLKNQIHDRTVVSWEFHRNFSSCWKTQIIVQQTFRVSLNSLFANLPQTLLSVNDYPMTQHFKPSLLNISKSLFLLTHFTVC